ncbi:MAG: thiopeptide-type bacteriocin biosynthesis protein [Gemmatimonadota bacterium]
MFAEIVHLPEGRVGNILCRPVLREHEIPYLGRSGARPNHQLPVTDLLVSVQDERIVLRSRRLGRQVLPRLTTAHDYSWRSLGLYRFLCTLQHQDVVASLAWDWGPLAEAPFLPRVVSGRLVLARARWRLTEHDIQAISRAGDVTQFATVQIWRAERQLPRYVALADYDNELVSDLDNVLSVAALAHQLRGRRSATLVEMFPGPHELWVTGPEGHFVSEFVVPFIRTTPAAQPVRPRIIPVNSTPVRRRFPPGSDWLYIKLYTGTATADVVLDQLADPVLAVLASGTADRWFFLRYADPDWHLRLRVHGAPQRLHGDVLPGLHAALAPLLEVGQVWRVQLDTYEREVERYGGAAAIELAEQIFAADSAASLTIVRSLAEDTGQEWRWRLALCGIDALFDDFGLTLEDKRRLARPAQQGFGGEFDVDGAFRSKVSARFRQQRTTLEWLVAPAIDPPPPAVPGRAALRQRSRQLAPLIGELRRLDQAGQLAVAIPELAASFAHLHVNRVLRAAQRAHELVLYELLDRLYSAQAARRQ